MPDRIGLDEVESEAALYALGALSAADAERFRQRLAAGCSLCRDALAECDPVVRLLPLAAPEADPPARLRARLMEQVASESTPAMRKGHLVRAGDSDWEESGAPGVQIRKLYGSKTMLVRMGPDTRIPTHDHRFAEQCLVLEGSIRSEGVTAHAGDYIYMPAGSVHGTIHSDTGATFLIAYS